MTNNVRKNCTTIALILLVLCSLLLSSCGISVDDGKTLVGDFCTALKGDDYERAAQLIHPSNEATAEQLRESISTIENRYSIDFSDGVSFLRCINMSSNSNIGTNGKVNSLSLSYEVVISGEELILSVVIVDSSEGYGIYSFVIESNTDAI